MLGIESERARQRSNRCSQALIFRHTHIRTINFTHRRRHSSLRQPLDALRKPDRRPPRRRVLRRVSRRRDVRRDARATVTREWQKNANLKQRSYFTLVAYHFDRPRALKGLCRSEEPSAFLRRATTHTGWCVRNERETNAKRAPYRAMRDDRDRSATRRRCEGWTTPETRGCAVRCRGKPRGGSMRGKWSHRDDASYDARARE